MTRPFVYFARLALGAAIVCGCVSASYGADWPQWRGLNRDGKSAETGLLKEWPAEGPAVMWTVEGIGTGHAAATVAGGMVYVTGMSGDKNDAKLSAFDLTGKPLWQRVFGTEWNDNYPGAKSSATVDGTRLYVISSLGTLACLDAKAGAILWSQDMTKAFGGVRPPCGYAEGVVVYQNLVICTPGGKDAGLAAVDKTNGKTVWTTKGFSDISGYCSPILIDHNKKRLLVTISAANVLGLDPATGKLAWRQSFDAGAEDPNHCVAPVYANGLLYATSAHREGGQMFELTPDGKQITPKWTDKVLNTVQGGLLELDGYVYGTNAKGKWVCLEIKTGTVKYVADGVGMGSIAYADGMLYCYGEKGKLGLAVASPESFQLVSSFRVSGGTGQHWAHPAISNGVLYIRHGDALIAYDIKKK